jgi:tetratricopeptide (TPR) repeat protein
MARRRIRETLYAALCVAALAAPAGMIGCSAFERRGAGEERVLVHVVGEGDTVEDIADDYYGDRGRARDIRRFNDIGRGEEAAAGAKLRIPMKPKDMETLERRRSARVPYDRGIDLAAKGSFLDATVKFREAIELDPRFAEAHFNLGVAYQRIKANKKALDELREAVRLHPDDADYRYAVGGAYFHLERYDRAVGEFERAIALDPFHAKARYSLAATLEKLGRVEEARRAWERYLQVDDSSEWADEARARLEKLRSR